MQFFEKQDLKKIVQYLTDTKGVSMPAIAKATNISLSTIKNIKFGKSGKKVYFDKIIAAYPEALAALESETTAPLPDTERKVLFQELGETASKLAEIKMMNRLRALVPRLEASENISEEELESLLLAYEVLGMKVPERFKK